MRTELFWIAGPWTGRLAISARPRGGDWLEDEVAKWRKSGIDVVTSLLTAEEELELNLEREREICEAAGLRFHSLPITDRSIPESDAEAVRLVEALQSELNGGKTVVIHCRQGIGRAGLVAAALLIERGVDPEEAIRRISEAREVPIPETPAQRRWIDSFAIAVALRR